MHVLKYGSSKLCLENFIYTKKFLFLKENEKKMRNSIEETSSLEENNRLLAEQILAESYGAISLVEVIYGSIHWKLAKEYTNLAFIYLEISKLAKQARAECEKAWKILVEDFRHQTRLELEKENGDDNDDGLATATTAHMYPNFNNHQMILNYIYGRASTILKR